VHHQERGLWGLLRSNVLVRRALRPAFAHLPMQDDDRLAIGGRSDIFQLFVGSEAPDADLWRRSDREVEALAAPASFTAGWHDVFLPSQLADFERLVAAGRTPRLVVGPWIHTSPGLFGASLREGLAWFDQHLRDGSAGSPMPVRVHVMGSKRWIDLPTWPPETSSRRLHLHPGGRIGEDVPPESPPDVHTYDPAHPTPSLGGAVLGMHAGRRDNRKVEGRADVLTYTTDPFPQPVTVLGTMRVHVQLHTDNPHIDVFARVCDVAPRGRSVNVADQLVRLGPAEVAADGSAVVDLHLHPTGHCFLAGHRLRLQISGGAHPHFARNLGTGEPISTGTATAPSRRQVFHDPARPSWIDLPTFAG
jgi:putative CocE/NonD family hydrolase